jgi:hypothetical protein
MQLYLLKCKVCVGILFLYEKLDWRLYEIGTYIEHLNKANSMVSNEI